MRRFARTIAVCFDSNVAPGLPWKFEPEQNTIDVKIGQVVTVYYTVTNQSARTTTGAGVLQRRAADRRRLFPEDQLLLLHRADHGARRKREMAVVFYVDPALAKDSENDTLKDHHLVLHFLPVRDAAPKPVAAGEAKQRKGL